MLKFLDHLLGGFTAKTSFRISAYAKLSDRLLGGKEAKLMYILKFLDHLLGGFTAKTTFRIPTPCETFGSSNRRERSQTHVYILIFLYHLLGVFTAKTTLRISKCLKTFGLFTRWFYRENDPPKILKQTLYQVGYRENDPHTAKTPFRVPRKRPLP